MTNPAFSALSTPQVELFILSHDRPDFCRLAVASALAQTYENCKVIVSDNSEGVEVAEMLACEFSSVTLIRRIPPLQGIDHFNQLILEASAAFMVLFHDDDILEPDYISRMVDLFQKNPHASAVGCNARIIRGEKLTAQLHMGNFQDTLWIHKPLELIEYYLSIGLTNPAPFPGYMYCTNRVKEIRLDRTKGGKHSDVSFLMQLLEHGPILWTDKCLIKYRMHSGNDSNAISIPDHLSLLRHIIKTTGISPKSNIIIDYKFRYWKIWLHKANNKLPYYSSSKGLRSHRHTIASKFVIYWGLRMAFTRLSFWQKTCHVIYRNLQKILP